MPAGYLYPAIPKTQAEKCMHACMLACTHACTHAHSKGRQPICMSTAPTHACMQACTQTAACTQHQHMLAFCTRHAAPGRITAASNALQSLQHRTQQRDLAKVPPQWARHVVPERHIAFERSHRACLDGPQCLGAPGAHKFAV
eukprot:363610-Chlamydomonas_euryale.AAC.7